MSDQSERPIVIVKRFRRAEHMSHGGAWKVAYADFVTAMMAFFLVMWLIASVSKNQRAAIFQYFKNPSMQQGHAPLESAGRIGPGGASTSMINFGGGLDSLHSATPLSTGLGLPHDRIARRVRKAARVDQAQRAAAAAAAAAADHRKLKALMAGLRAATAQDPDLKAFRKQLLLDITPEGLRIQIVDSRNRPMFDLGSAKLKPYTARILRSLAPYLNSVPNKISILGHTDTTPYTAKAGYNNWDLSSDRANSARRALERGGLKSGKIARVVGLSSTVLFDKRNPRDPINRRISIIVMTHQAEQAAKSLDGQTPISPSELRSIAPSH